MFTIVNQDLSNKPELLHELTTLFPKRDGINCSDLNPKIISYIRLEPPNYKVPVHVYSIDKKHLIEKNKLFKFNNIIKTFLSFNSAANDILKKPFDHLSKFEIQILVSIYNTNESGYNESFLKFSNIKIYREFDFFKITT